MPLSPTTARCKHIKINGQRCGSPALTEHPFCYYHNRAYLARKENEIIIPLIEDANSLQIAINQVMSALLNGKIDVDMARGALAALRISAINLPRTQFETCGQQETATDPVFEELFRRRCTIALARAQKTGEGVEQKAATSETAVAPLKVMVASS